MHVVLSILTCISNLTALVDCMGAALVVIFLPIIESREVFAAALGLRKVVTTDLPQATDEVNPTGKAGFELAELQVQSHPLPGHP